MPRAGPDKRRALQEEGALHPARSRVRAELFWAHPAFFDPRDEVQVKYEMLRAHFVDGRPVTEVCATFGYSRQTFYILQRRFARRGVGGLRDRRPGRVGPTKCTPGVIAFLQAQRKADPEIGTADLVDRLAQERGLRLHRRTVERLLGRPGRKKTLASSERADAPARALSAAHFFSPGDAAQAEYEERRAAFLASPTMPPEEIAGPSGSRSGLGPAGLAGLLTPAPHRWTIRCLPALRPIWTGALDSQATALLEAYRLVLGAAVTSGTTIPATLAATEEDEHAGRALRTRLHGTPGATGNDRLAAGGPAPLRRHARS